MKKIKDLFPRLTLTDSLSFMEDSVFTLSDELMKYRIVLKKRMKRSRYRLIKAFRAD